MTPSTPTVEVQATPSDFQTAVQVAALNGKFDQFIGSTERRLATVEAKLDQRGKNWPAIVACFASVAAVLITLGILLSGGGR